MSILEELRRKKGLTQRELGKLVGASQNTVSQWESGAYLPPTAKLILLSRILSASTDKILGLGGETPA